MKKIAMILAILLCISAFAYADTAPFRAEIEVGEDRMFDLTGEGIDQKIRAQYVGVEEDRNLQLVVFGTDGGVNLFDTEIRTLESGYITDLDEDGQYEILLSGSVLASDWLSYCLRFSEERGIEALPFDDIDRGSDRKGFTMHGYGYLTLNADKSVTLNGYQDVLGTHIGHRTFKLINNKMKLSDDGLWHFNTDPDQWEYRALMPKKPLPVTMSDGRKAELGIGDLLLITASDLKSKVYFVLTDGRSGSFEIEPNLKDGFGSMINGRPEDEYFAYLPYAG